jgi:hypothetical protein
MSWFYASIFALWVIIFMVYRYNVIRGPTSTTFQQFNLARIEQFSELPSRYKVVMLGNSRLKFATAFESKLATMSTELGISVAYLKIVQNEAQFSDFETFLEPILELKPNLILLQAPLFVMDRSRYLNWRYLQKYIVDAVRGYSDIGDKEGDVQHKLQFELHCAKRRLGMTTEQLATALIGERVRRTKGRGTYDLNGVNAHAVRTFAARASEAGTKIITLGIPKSAALNDALQDFYGERLIADQVLAQRETTWSFSKSIPDDEYCDLIHMDSAARLLYSIWLVKRVADRLLDQESLESASARAALKRINSS